MPGIARLGDVVGAGGLLTAPVSTDVRVNGRPVALDGCLYTPHAPFTGLHLTGPTLSLPRDIKVNGKPPIIKTSFAACGHMVMSASTDVLVGGGILSAVRLK